MPYAKKKGTGMRRHYRPINKVVNKQIKKYITKPEYKYNDVNTAPYTVLTSGSAQLMNGTVKGTEAVNQRIGYKIRNTYIKAFGDVYTTDNSASMTRIMIVYDKQSNGAAPAVTSILASASPYAQYLQELRHDRFTILYDKMFYTDTQFRTKIWKFQKKINLPTQYYSTGNAGLVSDIQRGSIHLISVTTNSNARLTLSTRVFYTDV